VLYLRYIARELRRRRGRTILTALGLGVGVALVVTVSALSSGLDEAQSKVLSPLTGVGTDMSVTRPIQVTGSGSGTSFSPDQGPPQLSAKEQKQLQRENGGGQFDFNKLGKPGHHFDATQFMTMNLSFPEKESRMVAAIDGVQATAGALTLNMVHLSGTVPKTSSGPQVAIGGPPGVAPSQAGGNVDFQPISVSGVDTSEPDLGLVTPSQITKGRYLPAGNGKQAVLSQTYADEHNLSVGDRVKVGDDDFKVVGVASAPLGGQSSDIYVPLKVLQRLSDREGRVNTLQVRADGSNDVTSVAAAIRKDFSGSQTTTSQDLANRVSGSLVDAKNLSSKLGTALAVVALVAAFGIASLLTLSSVNKRTREIGTLKAVGWRQWLVVRQISGESVAQGVLGGVIGAVLGIGGAMVIDALGISLDATVGAPSGGIVAPGGGPFGQGEVASGATSVALGAPVHAGVLLLAIALAVLGGVIAGAVGGSRAARLRPAEALRSVE
jgi:ABC-type antimicrobial peptide transport system permease subunit